MGTRGVALAIAGVAALMLGAFAFVTLRPDDPPVERALAIVDDDDRFTTALEASDAFAEIASVLGTVTCDAERDETCARTHRATAWAKVTAVLVAQCTPPIVFDARAGLGQYLRRGGELPPVPRCGARRQASSA